MMRFLEHHLVTSPPTNQKKVILYPWNSPGKNTGMGCHALIQGIFPTQGSKPRSPALQADSLPLSYQGSQPISASSSKSKFQAFHYHISFLIFSCIIYFNHASGPHIKPISFFKVHPSFPPYFTRLHSPLLLSSRN